MNREMATTEDKEEEMARASDADSFYVPCWYHILVDSSWACVPFSYQEHTIPLKRTSRKQ